MIPAAIKSVIDIGSSNLTKITLAPLNEHEVIEYVAATLYRSEEYCIPLAIVCLERTNG